MKLKLHNILRLIALSFILSATAFAASAQSPVANFTGSPLSGCSPVVVVFQDQSTGSPTSWSWNFGNGNTSTLQNPTATYFTPGTYNVTLTVTNATASNTLTRSQYVTVYEPPTVDFSATNTSGCFPLHVQFADLSSAGAGNTDVSWQWDFGNGVVSNLQNPFVTYTAAGNYNVTLKVTNDKGCTKTLSRPNYITVTPGVIASFTNTQPTVCGPPADISFTDASSGPGVLSYTWDFGDGGNSIQQNPVYTYLTSGTFTVKLVVISSAGCQDTATGAPPIVIGGFTTSFTAAANVCINETTSFTNTSSPIPSNVQWNFGDGNTGTGNTIVHSYGATGTYTVWMYNTFSICTDSVSKTITVNPRPVADFSAPVTSICQPPLTVNFQDLSGGGAVGWQWDFGDGGSSALQNPSHTYTTYGSFNVTLIATNGFGCTDTIVKNNFVIIKRAAISIPILPARGCVPYTITFAPNIISVDAVTSYKWDFGDGGTSVSPTPVYTYNTQGTYTVTLIITTSSGCTDTLTLQSAVKVGTHPVVNFSAAPIPVCADQPVFFTDLSAPADAWLWDFGDGGSSIMQNPSHIYTDTGFFKIKLIATNNGCDDSLIKNNYVRVLPPIAKFGFTANCSNRLQFTFTDQSIAPLTWAWDFGDGFTSALQNPVHTFPVLGSYSVRLIVTNGPCSDTVIKTVEALNTNPDFVATPLVSCKIAPIDFVIQNVNFANITNFYWDFGDGTQVNSTTHSFGKTYFSSGNYTVLLVSTDINGCLDSVSKINYIRINGPIAQFTATNTSGCAGLTTTFNDLSTTDGVNTLRNWKWDFGDGTIQNFSAPPFQHAYLTPGTFSVKLTVTDAYGCLDSVTVQNLIITTDPVPNFQVADTLTCPGALVNFLNTSSAINYTSFWDFGDGNTSAAPSVSHAYAAVGFYTVKLRIQDMYGCADSLIKNLYINVNKPAAAFSVNDSVSSCTPLQVQFTNASTFFTSLAWDFGPGQGTSTLTNPVHFYSTPGTYPVKLVATSHGGCKDSIIKNITVYDTVGARVSYFPINGCKPLSVSLNTFSPGPMASYLWDFGDGYTQTTSTPNVNHLYASFGFYLPKVIMQDPSGCLIPLPGLDTVLVTGSDINFGFDKNTLCDKGPVNFSDSTTFNDPIVLYNWLFGDGGSSPQQNPSHQYTAPGNYNVSLITLTQLGCRDTLTKINAIKVVESPLVDIGGDSVVCLNASLQNAGVFLRPDTSIVTWLWNFPNGNTSTNQNPLPQVYGTAGNFVITTLATNSSGCVDSVSQTLLVNPLPVVNMPGQMTVQSGFPATIPATYTPNTVNWLWSPAAGLSCAGCANPDAGPKYNTTYQVFFTDANGCSNKASIEVVVICGNENLFVPNTFSPNGDGSNDVFYPRGKGLARVKMMRIFNRWGEVVFEKKDFPVNDASSGWDGSYKGQKPQAGVYVYQLEVFCDNNEIITLNGNIALIL